MEILEKLVDYRNLIQPLLVEFFQKKIKIAKKTDPLATGAVKEIERVVLAGGKRIRPALVYYGFLAAGGKKNQAILEASLSIELMHVFLLIHDDIIDRDEKRHGLATVNKSYQAWGEKLLSLERKESEHFGNSMAIVVGDMAYSMANEILFEADFPASHILSALKKMQEIVYKTIPGEMLDIFLDARGDASEEEIMKMYDGKTARYTFEGPLHLGACLAGQGKNRELLSSFSDYALPIGQAFQLKDDILGVFGREEKLGKPVGSDVIEGKQTLLVVKALERANFQERRKIKRLLGKRNLSLKELGEFQLLLKKTGALEYAEKTGLKLLKEATEAVEKAQKSLVFDKKTAIFLKDLAEYIILRQV